MAEATVPQSASDQTLPVPPKIIARVIEVAAEPDSTAADLAAVVSKDPTLTAQVLRAVNSAHYGLRRRIETVQHAVSMMGVSTVRNLVLCIGVQQLARPEALPGFPLDAFWENSVRRAAAAACLARRLGLQQIDEFFTLGLCLDIGVLVSLRENREFSGEYATLLDQPAAIRYAAEQAAVGRSHDVLGFELFRAWKLADELSEVVRLHHGAAESVGEIQGRVGVAVAAEAVADLLQVQDKAAALEHAQNSLGRIALGPELLRPVVDEVVEDVAGAAQMLQLRVGSQPSYHEIIAKASDALVSLSLAAGNAASRDEVLSEQQRKTVELEQRNAELARQAATDPLTGLPNRRVFDDALEREVAQANRQGSCLSLLILDVDHFKQFNDTHGHRAGDLILQKVAGVVQQSVRKSDVCARVGGEEFAVVLPFTPRGGATIVADRMRQAVGELVLEWEGQALSVTVSVGGVTTSSEGTAAAGEALLEAADEAMYQAKAAGRDRVCWSGGA